ncbi:hypothetical protein BV898_07524 [Hypsibius exemplaris]|uniref:Insulin-like growth factor-binding protein complex acid labile subunit n=1 Tax=Hypsibius exemplaris TaxID=2072580 RepID=A0A1W0WT07_HYPEX|nr:hypothetical protein BV898_07524 [Hypsibius exemplaris]
MKSNGLFCVLLLALASVQVEGKCSRLPSGNCWVNCLQEIFDVICNRVTPEMVRMDVSVFADTTQQLRLYIWSSPLITRLSADVFSSVASQILTVDLQDVVNLEAFPELHLLPKLRRFNIWNSPKLCTLSLELLPASLFRLSINKICVNHFENDFSDVKALPNLQEFVLRNVTIKGWQGSFLKVFPNLTLFEISNSTFDFAAPVSGMTRVESIKKLKLFQNTVAENTTDGSMQFFGSLISSLKVVSGADVDISMNNLEIFDRATDNLNFAFRMAKRLNVRGNPIRARSEKLSTMFQGFLWLEELDMGLMDLHAVQGMFGGLPSLKSLKLDHNNLVDISQVDIFENAQFTNLSYLDLSYNGIKHFSTNDTYVQIAPQVLYLNLAGNSLNIFLPAADKRSEIQRTAISSFRSLKTLILADNGISLFSGRHLANLTKLTELDLSCNAFKKLTNEAFIGLSRRLEDIDLSMCIHPPHPPPWIEWDAFTTLPQNLKRLRLKSGAYKKWIFGVLKLSGVVLIRLEELYLDDNDITFLLNDTIPLMANLRTLSLSRNALQSISPGMFQGVPNLKTLKLNDNRIGTVGVNSFSSRLNRQLVWLQELDLSGNGLYAIERGTFDQLTFLRSLMIGRNPMEIQDVFVDGGRMLEYLGIEGYNRSCLKPEFFQPLKMLRWIFPDEYNLILANPDDRLRKADKHLESLLRVCEIGPDVPDHDLYPNIPTLKNYVSVTIHDTDEGEGVQYPMIEAWLPLNYCPLDDYVTKLSNIICTKASVMRKRTD